MLYFLHGDFNKVLAKSEQTVESLLAKKKDALVLRVDSENLSVEMINEYSGAQSLFAQKYIVTMLRVLENKEISDEIVDLVKQIAESENVFIWCEEKVTAKDLKKIEKYATKVLQIGEKKEYIQDKGDFALAEAFVRGDRKNAWILYLEAIQKMDVEKVFGSLWWQVKAILLAKKTKTAEEAGMKSFPYSKAKAVANKYDETVICKIADKMIDLYNQSRLGEGEMSVNLERFLLDKNF